MNSQPQANDLSASPTCSTSSMVVMPSNCVGFNAGFLFGKYPGRLAHLHSVERLAEPIQGIPWALDNGVFGAFSTGKEWSEEPLYRFLDKYSVVSFHRRIIKKGVAWLAKASRVAA